MSLDYTILRRAQSKVGFVPPPVEPQKAVEMAGQMIQEGSNPEQVVQELQQKGVDPNLAQQAVQEVMPQEEPPNLKEVSDQAFIEEKSTRALTSEDRLLKVEKQVEVLMGIVQELVGGLPPTKQAFEHSGIMAMIDTLENI